MISALISALFAAAALLALAAIGASVRTHGQAALALRQQLASCSPVREFRFALTANEVRCEGAKVYRPDFRAARPALPAALRAAA